jgi:hypothetical protein
MPAYQIHRLKETQRQQFRWAPHTPGVTVVKLKDYEPAEVVEAASPYALWLALRESDRPIAVGDLIQVVGDGSYQANAELRILKYIGFEEARWYVPEPASQTTGDRVAVT